MRWRRVYAGRADQVRAARAFAEALLVGMPCVDVVALAVGELAANAVRHTRSGEGGDGWFGLEIVCENPVYVAVTDMGGHGIPTVLPEGYGGSYSEGAGGSGCCTSSRSCSACTAAAPSDTRSGSTSTSTASWRPNRRRPPSWRHREGPAWINQAGWPLATRIANSREGLVFARLRAETGASSYFGGTAVKGHRLADLFSCTFIL